LACRTALLDSSLITSSESDTSAQGIRQADSTERQCSRAFVTAPSSGRRSNALRRSRMRAGLAVTLLPEAVTCTVPAQLMS